MNILKVITTSAIVGIASVANAQEKEFSEVDVTIQLGDAGGSNALNFWPEVETDMEAVIRQRVSTLYNPNGLNVSLNVTEISLDGSKDLPGDGAFNTLRGVAMIREDANGPVVAFEEFGLRAQPWETSIKDGMFLLADKADFYNAMLNNFANELVTVINEE
ncbi:MAG: hypothetical protein ABJF50_19615 [Paracoccaceae bacterium]